jgi:hypothetical protein
MSRRNGPIQTSSTDRAGFDRLLEAWRTRGDRDRRSTRELELDVEELQRRDVFR